MQRSGKQFKGAHYLLGAALLGLSPLAGVVLRSQTLAQYLQFPPTTRYIRHAPFQWSAFVLLLVFVASVCAPFCFRLVSHGVFRGESAADSHPFPWWGWCGTGVAALFWILAWNRFPFFRPLQPYTFFPLWASYILVVNGLSCRRKGTCLLRTRSRFFLALFPASSVFWWYFEYLNRFVQNWYYDLGLPHVSAVQYVIHSSICFSTVLPAVLSTTELLSTFPALTEPFADWHPVNISGKKVIGWFLLAGSALALSCLVVFPNYLFPLVWIAPLLVIVGMQLATGRPTIFSGVVKGDWRPVVLPALAALICGFFWEMWNWHSLAHWEYSVPFVHRFQIFAMPLIGYAGYLPFGLECAAVVDLLAEKFGMNYKMARTSYDQNTQGGPV